MNKMIGFCAFAFIGLLAFIPNVAHAAKLRIEPSITFRNSYTHYQPRQRVYVQRPPEVYRYYYGGYAPYYEEVVMVQPPRYFYEPNPYPAHVHSYGTDFGLKFKIK